MICDTCIYADKDTEEWPCKYCHPDTRERYYRRETKQYTDDQLRLAILYHTKLMEFLRNQTLN